jgi:hypothetical protein
MQKLSKNLCSGILLASLTLGGLPVRAAAHQTVAPAGATTPSAVAELLALLPEADVVAVIDAQRAFTELLPKLKGISTGGIGKTAGEIETLARLAGVEPKQIQTAVLGVKMTETLGRGSGVLLLQGLEVDPKRLGEAAKTLNGELKTTEHQGKPLYTLSFKPEENGQAETLHFALLNNKRVALGDLAGLQAVLAGGSKNAGQAAFIKALSETKATGLVRFAGNLPEGLRAMLASQGDLFAQVAAVKAIFGSLDLNSDNSATLDARLRTASNNEAAQLKENLNGLVGLGKVFLDSNDDPKMKLYSQLLDQVKINVAASDVSLLLQLPKEIFSRL